MINRQAIKENSKLQLGNRIFGNLWLMALLVCFLHEVLISAASGIITIGSIIIIGPLGVGLACVFLWLSRGQNEVKVENLFSGFSSQFSRNFLLGLLISIFTFLWTLLFIIPGIIKAYSYKMAFYIAVDHPEYTWRQCIDESVKMTNGHKMDLFILDLSFIGWYIVGALCLGIGTFWVIPYHNLSIANYYNALKTLQDTDFNLE